MVATVLWPYSHWNQTNSTEKWPKLKYVCSRLSVRTKHWRWGQLTRLYFLTVLEATSPYCWQYGDIFSWLMMTSLCVFTCQRGKEWPLIGSSLSLTVFTNLLILSDKKHTKITLFNLINPIAFNHCICWTRLLWELELQNTNSAGDIRWEIRNYICLL